ncbi:MAG: PAS domain S-box protein [Bacteroidota bacterium]
MPSNSGHAPPSPTEDGRGGLRDTLGAWALDRIDSLLPSTPISETERRRMRAIVVGAFVVLPFGIIITEQIYRHIGARDAAMAGLTVMTLLACPLLLRWSRSATVLGLVQAFSMLIIMVFMALLDGGLDDPSLYWIPLIPMAAAVTVGPIGTISTLIAGVVSLVGLYILTEQGYAFPNYTGGLVRIRFDMLALISGLAFAALVGWLYERHTRHELNRLSDGVRGLRGRLGQSEERYRQLFEQLPIGMYRTTPSGEIVLANASFLRMLGYTSLDDFRQAHPTVGSLYANEADRSTLVERLQEKGQVSQHELDLVARDGRTVHIRLNARAVTTEGTLQFFEGTVEDVTAHKEAQEQLQRSEERFRALVRHSSDIIVVLAAEGRIEYVSPAIGPMLGVSPRSQIGQPYARFLHPDDQPSMATMLQRALQQEGALPSIEVRLRHAQGHYVFAEVTGSNRLTDSHLHGLILNIRDITDRKRAETVLLKSKEHAEEVARFKSSFLANMSHEIRTPLTGILGFASVLAEEVDEHHREFVTLITRSGQRLLDTLNSVLDLARLEADRMDLSTEPLQVGPLVQEGVDLLSSLATTKGLALDVRVTAPDAHALLDEGAMNRIINNLVGNAIKFTREGEVDVLVEADSTLVRLVVRDTGPGIDEAFLPRIFSEFEQESQGIGRDHEGTGLGLTITQRLVEKLGGAIEVKSKKGVGTTFTVTFPRSDEAPADALPEAEEVPVAVLKRHRVLVVDDNQQTRFLMERMLHAHFDTDTAASAEETYQLTQAESYDAVLLDINLGAKASGEEVMQRLREDPHYATVPIVAFTAYALPGDRERFIHQGFDGYLSKPFTRKQLTALMHEMLPDAAASPDPDEVTGSLLLGPYPPRQTGQLRTPRNTEALPERQPLSASQDD